MQCKEAGQSGLTMIPMMMRLLAKSLQYSVGYAWQPTQPGSVSACRVQLLYKEQLHSVQPADADWIELHLHRQTYMRSKGLREDGVDWHTYARTSQLPAKIAMQLLAPDSM